MALETHIYCDACGYGISWNGTLPKYMALKWAREEGFSIGKYCLCSKCKGKRSQLKKEGRI